MQRGWHTIVSRLSPEVIVATGKKPTRFEKLIADSTIVNHHDELMGGVWSRVANPMTKATATSLPPPFEALPGGAGVIYFLCGRCMNEARATSRTTSTLVSLMLVVSTVLVGMTPAVQAVGPNQNDLNSGGDLPDNTSVNITNYIFSGSYSGSGELGLRR